MTRLVSSSILLRRSIFTPSLCLSEIKRLVLSPREKGKEERGNKEKERTKNTTNDPRESDQKVEQGRCPLSYGEMHRLDIVLEEDTYIVLRQSSLVLRSSRRSSSLILLLLFLLLLLLSFLLSLAHGSERREGREKKTNQVLHDHVR